MTIEVRNATPFAIGFTAGRVRGASPYHVTAIVKGAFRLVPGGRAQAAPAPLLSGDAQWDDDRAASCRYASDFAPWKPRADVLVAGTCHAPGAARTARAAFAVGRLEKAVAVIGEREWIRDSALDGDAPSEPKVFRSLPLRAEFAFGGPGYAANPFGRGADAAARPRSLPNIEHPAERVRTPSDRPSPAGFGPVAASSPRRTAKLGTYDAAWLKERWPYFPDDFDFGYFNVAPEDQQVDGYLAGDERLVFEGMHAARPRYESALPALRPRCFVRRVAAGGTNVEEVKLELDTLFVDVDAEELVLVWRGLVGVRTREHAELAKALLVVEPLAERPRAAADYAAETFWSAPRVDHVELAAAEEAKARAARAPRPPPQPPPAGPDERAMCDQIRADLEKAGVDAPLLERVKGVTSCAAMSSILIAALDERAAKNDPPNPPEPVAAQDLEKKVLAGLHADLAKAGVAAPLLAQVAAATRVVDAVEILVAASPAPTTPADAEAKKELVAAVAKARAVPPPEVLAAHEARAARGERLTKDEFLALVASGKSVAGVNLTELDLSGLDLRGKNLAAAKLGGARLGGCDLTGADLTGAVLRLADLRGARLDDAVLTAADLEDADLSRATLMRANAARARLEGARLDEALLDDADLAGACLAGASLRGARLTGAELHDADLRGANLGAASAARARFRAANLAEADLRGAALASAVFIGAKLGRANFAGASLAGAELGGASGAEVSFAGADLRGVRAGGAELPRADLSQVEGAGAFFAGAVLTGAEGSGAALVGADFSGADLGGASLSKARLERADLSRAQLRGAKLTRVNLFEARLGAADLRGADCRSSNLFGSDLFEALTEGARFERANLKRTALAARGST